MADDTVIRSLGTKKAEYVTTYTPSLLDAVPRSKQRASLGITEEALPFRGMDVWNAYEFTWLNNRGKPEIALAQLMVPAKSQGIIESKSLKLFLGSFRNHGAFHEDCTITIAKRLVDLLEPKWLRLGGYWYPRGGIPIDVFYQTGEQPKNVWVPPQDVPNYRGRG